MSLGTQDIHWLAGLLEGEGCFSVQKHVAKQNGKNPNKKRFHPIGTIQYLPVITLHMTDEDPVAKAASLLKVAAGKAPHTTVKGKAIYQLTACGIHAVGWMMTLYPLMGKRRKARIAEILANWKEYKPARLPQQLRKYEERYGSSRILPKAKVA